MLDNLELLENEIISSELDLKVEVVINEIIDKGISREALVVKPLGTLKRGYKKDISSLGSLNFTNDLSPEKIVFEITREGIYDALPEGVFHNHPSESKSKRRTKEDLIQDFHEGVEEEKQARDFFWPLESEFYLQRILLEEEERRSVLGFMNPKNQKMFFNFWGLPDIFTKEQLYILLKILPYSYFIKGNFLLIEQTLKALLKREVSVSYGSLAKTKSSIQHLKPLGEVILEQDFIVAGDFYDGFHSIQIQIIDVEKKQLAEFLPGTVNNQIIDTMANYFLSSNYQINKEIVVFKEDRYFIPQEKNISELQICHLGYDTYI